ncbi:hypothetical protein C1H46_011784 [Malus baccata]|uniref:Uncharacterized protein n=1 Tax=Malus baccata TaxID=106549 RepID=A0A540MV35_MALBA|nr:hypothetical protein C1H46_011784 [Malus baccata]
MRREIEEYRGGVDDKKERQGIKSTLTDVKRKPKRTLQPCHDISTHQALLCREEKGVVHATEMVKNEINRDATHLAAKEEEFGMPPVFVERQRWRETSSNGKEVVYHPSVLADEQATVEE